MRVRPIQPSDADTCGRIIFEAFVSIADRHNFPRDFTSMDDASSLARAFADTPGVFGVVAEVDGKVVGSNFLDHRDSIGAVGPITVDPAHHGRGTGRALMKAVIEHGKSRPELKGIRLVQDAFNTASMSLYASLGFEVREPLAVMQGRPKGGSSKANGARWMTERDIDRCAALCEQVHGLARPNELRGAMKHFKPVVLERTDGICAYCSAPNFWLLNHGVAETLQDMRQLLLGAAALSSEPISLLLPTRQGELFRWALSQGMKMIKPMTLMSIGDYQQPAGCFFPSVQY